MFVQAPQSSAVFSPVVWTSPLSFLPFLLFHRRIRLLTEIKVLEVMKSNCKASISSENTDSPWEFDPLSGMASPSAVYSHSIQVSDRISQGLYLGDCCWLQFPCMHAACQPATKGTGGLCCVENASPLSSPFPPTHAACLLAYLLGCYSSCPSRDHTDNRAGGRLWT